MCWVLLNCEDGGAFMLELMCRVCRTISSHPKRAMVFKRTNKKMENKGLLLVLILARLRQDPDEPGETEPPQ